MLLPIADGAAAGVAAVTAPVLLKWPPAKQADSQGAREPGGQTAGQVGLQTDHFGMNVNFISKVNNASYQTVDAALVQIVYQDITHTFWRYARCGKRRASWSLRSYVPLLEVVGQLVVSGRIFSYSVAVCALAAAP